MDVEDALLLFLSSESVASKMQNERAVSASEINCDRMVFGEYHHLFPQLKADPQKFFEYFRMNHSTFQYILDKISSHIEKDWCNLHQRKILPEERLMITIRYLSTGISFRSLAFSFRMGDNTVGAIVKEVVSAIWEQLQPLHMPTPTTEMLKEASKGFFEVWNFPHVVGCLDGKHVRIQCPSDSGSMFFNYRKFFSVILQGLADSGCKFLVIDVGGYGKQSDGGTFVASDLFKSIEDKRLVFPRKDCLPNTNIEAPYVMLADEAYPLLPYLMTPYKKAELDESRRLYNARLSRARKVVECAFGILYSKWRILSKCIETKVEVADLIIKCVCVLHNTIIDKEGFTRQLTEVEINMNTAMVNTPGRLSDDAKTVRDIFKYFLDKFSLSYV